MGAILIISLICLVFTLYALPAGVTKISQDDFLLMDRSAEVSQYSDTSIAYNLQITVTVYFFWWGFRFGAANVVFIITWLLGLFIFGLCAPLLARVLVDKRFDGSVFSLLSGGDRHLRIFMGLLFAIGLIGTQFVELYYTSDFIEAVSKSASPAQSGLHAYFWMSFGFLSFVVLWYCSLGGVRKVVATDTWQLSIAYISASIFIACLCPRIAEYAGSKAMSLISVGMAILFFVMACSPRIILLATKQSHARYRHSSSITFLSLIASAAISIVPFLTIGPHTENSAFLFPKPWDSMLKEPFGVAPIIGFTIINLLWQFGDYTAYHRLALLRLPAAYNDKVGRIRQSVFSTMLNSPLTWGLGIFAGMAVDATGLLPTGTADVFADFTRRASELANNGDLFLKWSLWGLAAFLGSVLLSTVDSGFMSVVLIIVRDILKKPLEPVARFIVNLAVVALMALLAATLVEFNVDILVFVNTTYAWGLVFVAPLIVLLLGRRCNRWTVYVALITGAFGASLATVNPFGLMPDLVLLVAPSLTAIVLSAVFVVIGLRKSERLAPLELP